MIIKAYDGNGNQISTDTKYSFFSESNGVEAGWITDNNSWSNGDSTNSQTDAGTDIIDNELEIGATIQLGVISEENRMQDVSMVKLLMVHLFITLVRLQK